MTNDKALEAALLACPFCGGSPEEHWPNSTTKHFIQCWGCGARTSINLASHGGSARDEWNRRVPVSALPGEGEVVEFRGDAEKIRWLSAERERLIKAAVNVATQRNELLLSLQAMQARAEAAEEANEALGEKT